MPKKKAGKEITIKFSDELKKQMADDPEAAAAVRDLCAIFRQAAHDVETEKYESFDDAMEAVTGNRPKLVSIDEE